MIIPGVAMSSGRVDVTISASPTADHQTSGGFGLAADGTVCIDSAAPSGDNYIKGFRVNATGCLFGTTSANASDVWLGGIRVSAAGAVVYEAAAAVGAANGDPYTSNGRWAVI